MAKYYTEADVDKSVLKNKKICVLGYGSQGRGQALNLRDSGLDVVVGLRKGGASWEQAEKDGWEPMEPEQAVKSADLVAVLVPDLAQAALYRDIIQPNLKHGGSLLFSHGFNIHFKQIKADDGIDVIMVAPKGPGRLVREQYEAGMGVPCVVAIEHDASGEALKRALAYASAIGGTKAGVIQTTFAEETETDLFGEQAVLCGGVTELIAAGFDTLVEAGYQPEVAYFECLHEVKLIVDLIYQGGFARMHKFVSDTAKYGDLTRGPRVVNEATRLEMKKILNEIQNGKFANEWIEETRSGEKNYRALLKADLEHPVEKVGKELRSKMSWIQAND